MQHTDNEATVDREPYGLHRLHRRPLEGPWSRVTRDDISGHASRGRCELLSTHSTAPHGLALKGRLYPVKVALVQGCAWRDLTPHGLFLECLAKPMKFVRST
jgi:hypothetical protein